jgi:hypothetical protein
MAKKQIELTDHLFDVLLDLKNKELTGEKLNEEIARSKAIIEVAGQIIANGALIANACRMASTASNNMRLPLLLTDEE